MSLQYNKYTIGIQDPECVIGYNSSTKMIKEHVGYKIACIQDTQDKQGHVGEYICV